MPSSPARPSGSFYALCTELISTALPDQPPEVIAAYATTVTMTTGRRQGRRIRLPIGTALAQVDLTGTDLTDADLTGIDLTDTRLGLVRWTVNTIWPTHIATTMRHRSDEIATGLFLIRPDAPAPDGG